MAKDAISEFLHLADVVRVAADLARREASLDQAIGEAEARLAGLRSDETSLAYGLAQEQASIDRQIAGARAQAESIVKAAEETARRTLVNLEETCRARESKAASVIAHCEAYEAQLRDRISILEAEEAALGQSVASLRSDLIALRARLAL